MKGVSPLVASVLLIALTVSVSFLVNNWISKFVEDVLETQTQRYEEMMGCLESSFEIKSYSIENNRFEAILENTGLHTLYNFKVFYSAENKLTVESLDIQLRPKEMVKIEVKLLYYPERMRIVATSDKCPGVGRNVF